MPPEQVTLALTGFSRVHQLEKVVSHDGQSEGLVEMLAMAAQCTKNGAHRAPPDHGQQKET